MRQRAGVRAGVASPEQNNDNKDITKTHKTPTPTTLGNQKNVHSDNNKRVNNNNSNGTTTTNTNTTATNITIIILIKNQSACCRLAVA